VDARKGKVSEENPRQEFPEDRRLPEQDGQVSMSFAVTRITTRYRRSGMEGSYPAAKAIAGNRRTAKNRNPQDGSFLKFRPLPFI